MKATPPVQFSADDKMTAALFRSGVALRCTKARIRAISGDAADRAWAEVMDAFYAWVRSEPEGQP